MTSKERQQQRARIAETNGYKRAPLPEDPDWAGVRLPSAIDERAAKAAAKLRGLKR